MRRFRRAACAAVLLLSFGCATDGSEGRHEELWVEPDAECQIQYHPLTVDYEYRGAVDIINTATELIVEVRRSGDWMIESATVYVGSGTPPSDPTALPHRYDFTGGPVMLTVFRIPLSEIGAACGETIHLGVSAVVVKDYLRETAWAKNLDYPVSSAPEKRLLPYEICCEPEHDGGTPPKHDAGVDAGKPYADAGMDAGPPDAGKGCVRTQGFWKRHPGAWPVDELFIGGVRYTKGELIDLMDMATRGDASLILLRQLVAALLNQLSGAAVPPEVAAAIAAAQMWMADNQDSDGRLPYGVHASTAAGQEALEIKDILEDYNEGRAGVPSCR